MFFEPTTLLFCFGGIAFIGIVAVVLLGSRGNVADRLKDVATDHDKGLSFPPAEGTDGEELPQNPLDRKARSAFQKEEKKRKLRERLTQSGFYATAAGSMFVAVRLCLIVGAAILGFVISMFGELQVLHGVLIGTVCGIFATIAPGFWLDILKRGRQDQLRCALPDAMDVLIVCLQGGLSVMASLSRVANELSVAHPMLAVEFKIAERQMQLGQSAGDAIRGIANRFDMEELRGMSATLNQAERVGASVATALEVFGETLRDKRFQRAEETGHKAAVKLLFPTVFFVMPAMFVVILGPAAIQVYQTLIVGM